MIKIVTDLLNDNKDIIQAKKMSLYMQNRFIFAGIDKTKLKQLIQAIISTTRKQSIDWNFIFSLWNLEYREAQYIAIEYLKLHHKQLTSNDLDNLKKLIIIKSWWDTVDNIDSFIGELVLKDESLKSVMLSWANSDNIWMKRVAIDFQQKYKEDTDVKLLEDVIIVNLNSKEFFINKAIGWSLREYSKTNPRWVNDFINKYRNELAPLSIKEASKYL